MRSQNTAPSETLVRRAAEAFGTETESLKKIGGFENVLYSFTRDDRPHVLRFAHSTHRSAEQIMSELHWVRFLRARGVSVAAPVPSRTGRIVEVFAQDGDREGPRDDEEDDGTGAPYFTVAAFERANGEHVHAGHPEWNSGLFRAWGRLTAEMHRATLEYDPPPSIAKRPVEEYFRMDIERLPQAKAAVYRKHREAVEYVLRLPRDPSGFGLCHTDLHQGNFMVQDGRITAFDFDDASNDFFVGDVAIAVYYSSNFPTWTAPETDRRRRSSFAARFFEDFMEGYETVHHLDRGWFEHLPVFYERRRTTLVLLLYDVWGPGHKNAAQRDWLEENVSEIERGLPCFDF